MPRPSTAKPPTSPPRWTFRRILNQWGLGGLINKSASGVSVTALKTIGWNILSTRILVSPTGNIAHELVVRRIYSIQLDYFVPFGAAAGKPIPVPAHWKQPNEILGAAAQDLRDGGEASIEDDNALQNMTLEYIKGALNLIHKLSGDKRIVFREANHNSEDDDNAYEPRMFVRSSSSIQQQSAIINLMNLLRLPDDLHTGELLVDRSLGAAIQAYFDEAAHEGTPYRYVIYSNTDFNLFKPLSPITRGARPDICTARHVAVNGLDIVDVFLGSIALFAAEAKRDNKERSTAIAQATVVVQATIALFVILHYIKCGWKWNHPLGPSDAKVHMDARSFVLSIFYSSEEVSIFAHYPTLIVTGSTCRWSLVTQCLHTYEVSQSLRYNERQQLDRAFAAVEQHIHVLKMWFCTLSRTQRSTLKNLLEAEEPSEVHN